MDRDDNVAQFPSLWPYLNSNIVGGALTEHDDDGNVDGRQR